NLLSSSLFFVTSSFSSISRKIISNNDHIIKNMEYSCSGRNLTHIPSSLPFTVTSLDFSFNFVSSLHKCVFPVLLNLEVLDLTR
uniref:Uncharacterized protein n=1 Tax=Sinocyclocheilus grahami TaxID=75366 RepID=A0A672RP33_SINGR